MRSIFLWSVHIKFCFGFNWNPCKWTMKLVSTITQGALKLIRTLKWWKKNWVYDASPMWVSIHWKDYSIRWLRLSAIQSRRIFTLFFFLFVFLRKGTREVGHTFKVFKYLNIVLITAMHVSVRAPQLEGGMFIPNMFTPDGGSMIYELVCEKRSP